MNALFQPFLDRQGVVILDGAQGTEFERHGVDLTGTALWSSQVLIDNPSLVQQVHLDYLRAGADVITTVTYQASPAGLASAGLSGAAADQLLQAAVQCAAAARAQFMQEQADSASSAPATIHMRQIESRPGENNSQHSAAAAPASAPAGQQLATTPQHRLRPLIAYSCGSYGASLCDGSEFTGAYGGSMSLQELKDFHRARVAPIRDAPEVDLLAFETVPCLVEALAIAELLEEEQYHMPAWISFSCVSATSTCAGDSFADQCIPALAGRSGIAALGVNCTAPAYVGALLSAAASKLDALNFTAPSGRTAVHLHTGPHAQKTTSVLEPDHSLKAGDSGADGGAGTRSKERPLLLCYPNSGETFDGMRRCWVVGSEHGARGGKSPVEAFAEAAQNWVQSGCQGVGGCCRTTPAHISALRTALCVDSL